jgi:hypothetical protein
VVSSFAPAPRVGSLAALGFAVACSASEPSKPGGVPVVSRELSRVAAAPIATTVPPAAAVAPPPPELELEAADAEVEAAASEEFEGAPLAADPELVATARETIVYAEPTRRSSKLGYLRLGARVWRAEHASGQEGCAGGWYRIAPAGYVCVGPAASLDSTHPIGQLAAVRPNRDAGLPYAYGRAKGVPPPLYTYLPGKTETRALEGEIARRASGWDDLETEPTPEELLAGGSLPTPFGYARPTAGTPARALPNAGFALLGTFDHEARRFGMTSDLELVPLDRLDRVEQGEFHGLVLDTETTLPVVFVRSRRAFLYEGSDNTGLRPVRPLAYREAIAVVGQSRSIGGLKFLQTRSGAFVRDENLVRVDAPARLPAFAKPGRTWLRVSITDQTLIAFVGDRPAYVTLVSTGSAGLADPKEAHATPRGEFVIHTKHVTASMNGDEVGDEYDLRDVPYVQYFTEGYALHAAYWHENFGTPHSHGCVNLSPLDARFLFHFTAPAVPQGWHGAFSREGSLLSIVP